MGLRTEFFDVVVVCKLNIGWKDKIVILKKTTPQFYFKDFIEEINSGNLFMW